MLVEIKEIENNICMIKVPEEFQIENASEIKKEIEVLIRDEKLKILIDMSDLEYIDSSGLGVLISIMKKIKLEKGKMILLSPQKSIVQILELTSLDNVFIINNDLENAIEEFKII